MAEFELQSPEEASEPSGKSIAILSEGLYLLNLLFPLLPLLGLGWLYSLYRHHETRMVRIHVRQTFYSAIISTGMFLAANLLILTLGGYFSLHALIIFEVYYIFIVPLFLLPGLVGLTKALSGQVYKFPLIGRADAA